MRALSLFLLSVFLLSSCASRVDVLKPGGDTGAVFFKNSYKHKVEMLAVSESNLYLRDEDQIITVPLSDVKKIYIHDYRISPALKIFGSMPFLLVDFAVMGVAFSVDEPAWGVAAGLTMVGTVVLLFVEDPSVVFLAPFEKDELEKLRLYCRYPQGLNEEQWRKLLESFDQEDFKNIPPESHLEFLRQLPSFRY